MSSIRVRFAPSPTGRLHLGGARTALFNYLFAKSGQGSAILRIEDTDRERFVAGSTKDIEDSLNWLGLRFDEGPHRGGSCGPYVQSERIPLYQHHAKELISSGHAYHCFCSKERLKELTYGYDKLCRTLSTRKIQEKLRGGEPYVVRLKVPDSGHTIITDKVFGKVEVENSSINDQILLKTDGTPTYHLAAVVDDHHMQISHVLRGEEWLLSTAKHLLLYSCFNWTPPTFAHLPLLMAGSGKKLSKRYGDTFLYQYKDRGFQPESIVSFLATLGWRSRSCDEDTTNKSNVKCLHELSKEFALENVCKDSVVVDEEYLKWLNKVHYTNKLRDTGSLEKMAHDLHLEATSVFNIPINHELCSLDRMKAILTTLQDRIPFIQDIPQAAFYFWIPPTVNSSMFCQWGADHSAHCLQGVSDLVSSCGVENRDHLHSAIKNLANSLEISTKKILAPTRLALTGMKDGPSLYDVMRTLGETEVLSRLNRVITELEQTTGVSVS